MTLDHPIDLDALAGRLGIDDEALLRELEAMGPPPGGVHLPLGSELTSTLGRLGLDPADVEDVAAAAPDPARTPDLWWLLERCAHRVIQTVGRWEEVSGPWPKPGAHLGPEGRCFWIYVYLAALPSVRRWHQERGIPDEVSWATLADLGRHVARHRSRYGVAGLDLESVRWFRLHFSCGLYTLGRLQFNLYRLRTGIVAGPRSGCQPGEERETEPGLRAGDPALGTHISETGPLDPDACDASFRRARTFFPRYFPDHPFRIATCSSWLLDDQLKAYLPPTSNIVRFQDRFQLVPGAAERDEDIFWFVFHRPPEAIDGLEPRSTLERAIVTHVRTGHHWRVRTGWLEP